MERARCRRRDACTSSLLLSGAAAASRRARAAKDRVDAGREAFDDAVEVGEGPAEVFLDFLEMEAGARRAAAAGPVIDANPKDEGMDALGPGARIGGWPPRGALVVSLQSGVHRRDVGSRVHIEAR